jgi:glucose/sorbosone dehydrogenase
LINVAEICLSGGKYMKVAILTILAAVLVIVQAWVGGMSPAAAQVNNFRYPSGFQIAKDGTSVLVEDYATLPLSRWDFDEAKPPANDFEGLPYQLARANVLASEPASAPQSSMRFFVIDQNGPLYILEKATKKFSKYIDFSKAFPNFANASPNGGFGTGLGSIAFDPGYARNGKFYTVHTEKPGFSTAGAASKVQLAGLDPRGFMTTAVVNPPAGPVGFESVLMEWTDTNIRNSTFEGRGREILRAGFSFVYHPMGDPVFNPTARPGDPDYGNLYVSMGDGTAGERAGITHTIPQRLDALQGKILRITPDITLRPKDKLSPNGQYRIPTEGPNANPFVSVSIARPEIYAYGLRNPHRMSWDPVSNTLFANSIGAGSWEDIVIVSRGANFGWAEREGPEQVFVGGPSNGRTGGKMDPPTPLPSPDLITVEGLEKPVTPVYPAAAFSHRDGASIGSGFVYRGKLMPQFVGMYLFSDIVTGRLFYCDVSDMLASHGLPNKLAPIHELQVVYKSPYDAAAGPVKRRMFDIVADGYSHREGFPIPRVVLPGMAALTNSGQVDPDGVAYRGGRADVRMSMGGDGEIYLLSKSDGMIRKLSAVVSPPPRNVSEK